jgi:4-amino-4-deoxy-L-arabinose transferase-like glycosyltransferase
MAPLRPRVRFQSYVFAFGVIATFLILAHGPLLRLPFFWDEAGQFVPASLDIYRSGAWIPVSTVPNVHPPGVMACLAAVWTVFGYSIESTRITMLLIASFGVLFSFLLAIELARGSPGSPAFLALVLLCLNPLFFAQSMLAQLDMPAMVLSVLALLLFLQDRTRACAVACAALVLTKETGLIAPALFVAWLFYERRGREAVWFIASPALLIVWLVLLHRYTGHWFGNSAFTSYNLPDPKDPARIALALLRRIYYLFIGSGHFIGTAALIWAWTRMPLLRSRPWRIAASFVVAQMLVMSLLGGAVLERYLLPALPVVYAGFAVALQAVRPTERRLAVAGLAICLIAANFINPIYPFPLENDLAFVDFVRLEQDATAAVRGGSVASVFPLTDALRNPDLGFVERAQRVTEITDFSPHEIARMKADPPEQLVVWNRDWDPLGLLAHPAVRDFVAKHYGYVPDMSADEIAVELSMRVVRRWKRHGFSMQLLSR